MRFIRPSHLLSLVSIPVLLAGPAFSGGPLCTPQMLGSSASGTVRDIVVQDDVVYCAASDSVDLFDVSNPTQPVLLGSWAPGGEGLDSIAVGGDLALVGAKDAGTYVLDVSDPTQPTPVANIPVTAPDWARGVEISGTTGFVGVIAPFGGLLGGDAPFGEIRSYDLADPLNPVLLDTVTAQAPIRTFLDGNRLFAAGGDAFSLFDVSDPSAMTVTGSYAGSPLLFDINDVCASGDLAFVSNRDEPGAVIDLSDPASPFPIAPFGSLGDSVFAVGQTVYIASSRFGGWLSVFDVGNPLAPVELGADFDLGIALSVVSDGELVYTGVVGAMTVLDASACTGSPYTSFCDGSDGTLAGCPCGNAGGEATGCDNPQGTGGVRLAVIAQETGAQNRATLEGGGFPTGSTPTSIVIRSETLEPTPVTFGDGLLCVGVPIVRLAPGFATDGVSMHVIGHGAMAGSGSFYYQLWYRSTPAMFCSPDAFNLSNGTAISW